MEAQYSNHPAAELFPMMEEAELQKLADDIAANGQVEPIALYQEQILDGRNRYAACALAGVNPVFHTPEPPITDPYTYVLSKNLKRRHLDPETRAWITAMSMPQLMEEAKRRQGGSGRYGSLSPDNKPAGRAQEIAAEVADVSSATIQRGRSEGSTRAG